MSEYENWSVEKKLSRARAILASKTLKKSGVNKQKYQDKRTGEWKEIGFSYFELSDFLPDTLKIFDEIGLCGIFRIEPAYSEEKQDGDLKVTVNYPEVAELEISNTDKENDFITFREPTANVEMKTAIQSLGAKKTYLRRYLWIDAMEIAENDIVDAQQLDAEEEKSANKKQKEPQKKQEAPKQTAPKKKQEVSDMSDVSKMAVEMTRLVGELKKINVDIHNEAVSDYIKQKASVNTVDGGLLLNDPPAMTRVIAVLGSILRSKAS